jgi:hypothetical protein
VIHSASLAEGGMHARSAQRARSAKRETRG